VKDLLDKLTSYNLFNYLLPGTIFVACAERVTRWRFDQDNVVVELFVYYFIGLVISRFGSLLLEPILRRSGLIKFSDYKDFIKACSVDSKIEVLSEQNNMFRTLAATFASLLVFKLIDLFAQWLGLSDRSGHLLAFAGLFVLFVSAYRKQTAFVRSRVEANTK
jgi:hypothetical protein